MSDSTRKTALITGASSGIGLETAIYFLEHGWNVVATMRHPEQRHTPLHDRGMAQGHALDLVHLDVMDPVSIKAAIDRATETYGAVEVLVNNAGYAVYGPFEAITQEQVARQFNTNVFGLLEVTRQMLPLFRRQNGGVLVNVTSMGGRLGFPLYSLYNSTKWAVEGFSEALLYEMRPLNIRVKVIEPGVIKTDFYERSLDVADGTPLAQEYCDLQGRCRKNIDKAPQNGAEPRRVAEVIYRAATDGSWRLRYPVGSDARQAWFLRRVLPEAAFRKVLERAVID